MWYVGQEGYNSEHRHSHTYPGTLRTAIWVKKVNATISLIYILVNQGVDIISKNDISSLYFYWD